MDSPKYANFDISEVAYKEVNGQSISAFVMVPQGLSPGKYPIIGKFHGGFFVTGASLYPDWFPQWALDYSLKHLGIIVAADYRLMPESNGLDILEDLSDFWAWVRNGLGEHLSKVSAGIQPDLEKVITYGESAGGTLSIHSALTQPLGFIKAVIATYPGINLGVKRTVPIMGSPDIPRNILEDHLKAVEPGKIITSTNPPGRMQIALSIAQQGRFWDLFGTDDRLYLRKVLETVDDVPLMLVLHGRDDTAVPVQGSIDFAAAVKQKFGENKIDLRLEPGEHGFDGTANLETPWLKEGLSQVTKLWLG